MSRSNTAALRTTYLTKQDKGALTNRLSRACGQIQGVKVAIEEGECVDKLLIQIAAARSALTKVALILAEEHLSSCVTKCMPGTREEVTRKVTRALAAVIKNS